MTKFGKLSINRSTGFGAIYTFWQVVASIGDQHRFGALLVQNLTSTIWKMTKIVNQRINRFWTHTHIWKMASLCQSQLVINKSTPFWRAIGSKFDFSTLVKIWKMANQQINRILTHTHILEIESLR